MSYLPELSSAHLPGPSVVTLGTFDGVHLGHQRLLGEVASRARARGGRAVALTFDPPPRMVLRPDPEYRLLSSLEERVELLRRHGADDVLLVRFDLSVAARTAEEFTAELVERLGMVEVVGGPDMACGRARQGTPPVLREIGSRLGFSVTVLEQRAIDGQPVRSVEIRRRLREGDVAGAAELLGRAPTVGGEVVHGAGRGRTIGIPTANLAVPPERVVPANGVYAGRAQDPPRTAVVNVGVRPTVGGGERTVEAHLLDFDGDLYGRQLTVELLARLREERKFPSLDALVEQIHRDIGAARELLDPA